ncbi:MAG: FtsX-like permease family protein, partial [Blastocatellia bacterium]
LRGVRGISGVEADGLTTLLPLGGDDSEGQFYINGRPVPPPSQMPLGMFYIVSPGYVESMHIPLQQGRLFDQNDTTRSRNVALIDREFKELYFKDEDPIGKHFTLWGGGTLSFEMEIVGVVGHVKQENLNTPLGSAVSPQYYMPFDQIPDQWIAAGTGGLTMTVKTGSDPSAYVSSIREQVRAIDRDVPLYGARTMNEIAASAIAQQRLALILLGSFAVLALILASIGIYGVMSYGVVQRTHEIGIRLALGARRSTVLGLVVSDGLKLAVVGVAIGLAGALVFTGFLSNLLYGVTARDPVTFVLVPLALAFVAALASYIPALKATKVDPIVALRYE